VRITITGSYSWLPFFHFSSPSSSISASATMRLENAIAGSWIPASSCT
jgi:hypothetical protein